MKYIILVVAFISTLIAGEVTVGAGPYMQSQPYKGLDNPIITPSPVIFFDNSLVYVRWTRAGIYFLGDKQDNSAWGFSLTAQPRVNQYRASESNYLTGMEDRESSIEGGLAFSANIDKFTLDITALTDVLSRHDTWVLKTELGYEFKLDNFTFYPSLVLAYQSSYFMDYYYGVNQSEATTQRAYYSPQNSLQYGVQTYVKYPLTDNLSAFGNIKADKLANEAADSPIVKDDYIFSGLVSLIYTFHY